MNPIGNNILINQQAPAISNMVSSNANVIAAQSIVTAQILANKTDLIKRAKKIGKSKSIDPDLEHEKETQREYHLSTEEYENIFMHENHLPSISRKKKLEDDIKEKISHYQEVSENAHISEEYHNHIPAQRHNACLILTTID